MVTPVIVPSDSIPNPDRPGEYLTPTPAPSRNTTILIIAALVVGAYGLYKMAKEDEELEGELEDEYEDDEYDDEDDDGPPDTGPFSAPDTGPIGR